jgi:hypothetical protein
MASLPEEYRQKASEQRELSKQLVEDPKLLEKPKLLVAAIAGQVNATVLSSLADVMDYLRVTTGQDSRLQRLNDIVTRANALRTAAARGDWSELDKMTEGEEPANGGSVQP